MKLLGNCYFLYAREIYKHILQRKITLGMLLSQSFIMDPESPYEKKVGSKNIYIYT